VSKPKGPVKGDGEAGGAPEARRNRVPEARRNGAIDARRAALRARFAVWTPATLSDFLSRSAAEYGDRPFVLTDERTLSYAEADAWASELADGLAALGVRPGERVGMLMANYLEFVPVKFAIARAGAVAIPFNYLYRQEELGYVLRQSGCNALVTMTSFGGLDYLEMLDAIAPGWRDGATAELPDLRRVVLLDTAAPGEEARSGDTGGPGRDGVLDVAGLAALGREHPGAADATAVTPGSPGDILYTSGTTGLPKGVVVSHDAVLRTSYASALTRAYQDGRRILFSLPCYHMFGYVEGLLSVMFVGGAIIPRTAFSPADYFASIERHRATEILAVPTMTVALLEHPGLAGYDLSSLTAILSGAAPAPVWLWHKVRAELGVAEITTGYGMTECGGAMTLTLPEDPLEFHSATVGRPKLAGAAGLDPATSAADAQRGGDLCTYKTVDPVTGEDLPDGTEGELASTGPTHMLGYWDKPEETAQALRAGWVYSGDLGVVQPDGYLRVTGRSKELYKSGGELVMPKEIEDLLTRHPGVSQAFVVGVPDDRWGDVGCAWVVPEPGAVVDAGELVALCQEKLARFKVPRHVLFLSPAELPTTPTGKVQKFRLAQRAAERVRG
jgi:fatty-acyl-CoA synthase